MEELTIKSAFAMGERDEKYGQSYWCEVAEMIFPVKFNLMSGSVQEGDKITFEVQEIKKTGPNSKNPGKEYRQLRKVKVLEGGPREVSTEQVALNDLEARVKALEEAVYEKKAIEEDIPGEWQ